MLPMAVSKARKRVSIAVGASFVTHAIVLGVMGALADRQRAYIPLDKPAIDILIEPRILLPSEAARRPSQVASPDQTERAATSPTTGSPTRPNTRQVESDLRVTPSETPGTARQNDQGRGSNWQVGPDANLGERVGRSLRTSVLGCQYPERLTREERAICDERETDRAVRALERVPRIEGTGNDQRDSRFEAQGREKLRAYERNRAQPPDSQRGNVGVQDGPGSNFGIGVTGQHLDPSLRPDSTGPIQTRRRDGRPEDRPRQTPN